MKCADLQCRPTLEGPGGAPHLSFLETIRRAKAFLQEQGRVSLRALQREFELDAASLDELVDELVDVQQVAAREGKVLAWIGTAAMSAAERRAAPEAEVMRSNGKEVWPELEPLTQRVGARSKMSS